MSTLAPFVVAVGWIGATILLALVAYGLMRRIALPHTVGETRDLAGAIMFRVAALHGLVLALVFAQELGEIGDIREAGEQEAALVADIYYDLVRYDADATAPIRAALARYAIAVADEEWQTLATERRLSQAAWTEWEAAYNQLLDLAPSTLRQERLAAIMLTDIRALSSLREARENAALAGTGHLFLIAAVAGVMLTAAAFFTWPPTGLNLSLIGAFAGFAGLIIHLIVAFSNPYQPPGRAEPLGFERFLTDAVRASAGG